MQHLGLVVLLEEKEENDDVFLLHDHEGDLVPLPEVVFELLPER